MPAKRRLTMRQLRQMLRLTRDGVSAREIAETLGVARSTIQDNLKRATAAGLSWPLPGEMTDDVLENRLFDHAGVKQGIRRRPEPDWAEVAVELKKPGVTLQSTHPAWTAVKNFFSLQRQSGACAFRVKLSTSYRNVVRE
ncbi:helix-turn-helix domain-containing protein, partial [Jiella sp. M17.18]|uniref:helix-turn-helix domain-containing protein n=1 Tax=Jiella sp. M17.18 TaxID=3234247 RepID=UPI0034E02977